MDEKIIEVNNVSMMFNKSKERIDNVKEYFIRFIKRQIMIEEFWALKNVSFDVKKGEFLGIIGLNGSGKSTLLKLISGVMKPTNGNINVKGTIAPLIELGAGFDMNLSARENVFLNGAVLGFSRKEMQKKFEWIIDFAELWDFVDSPIKNYSSGMIARLGFSIATASNPDILIVDEILGVGDFKFQQKCHRRMNEIIESGATVLFVSHSINQIKELCSRVVWLNNGELVDIGDTQRICEKYIKES